MTYTEAFAKKLVLLREERGLTQQQLADELEITRQSLSLYEKAERTINIELLGKISDFFGVSTDYLLGRIDIKTTDTTVQDICEYTGLSEKAVRNIKQIEKDSKQKSDTDNKLTTLSVFNLICENEEIYKLCDEIIDFLVVKPLTLKIIKSDINSLHFKMSDLSNKIDEKRFIIRKEQREMEKRRESVNTEQYITMQKKLNEYHQTLASYQMKCSMLEHDYNKLNCNPSWKAEEISKNFIFKTLEKTGQLYSSQTQNE